MEKKICLTEEEISVLKKVLDTLETRNEEAIYKVRCNQSQYADSNMVSEWRNEISIAKTILSKMEK